MPRLENWSLLILDPYKAPEVADYGLFGIVYDHPLHEDGTNVTTSRPIDYNNETQEIITNSGTRYTLGEINPEYAKLFPNSLERLIKTLGESNVQV